MFRAILATLFICMHLACQVMAADKPLAHIVFFTLADNSPENQQTLVKACQQYLSGHEGELYFSAGVIADDMQRDVNDRDFGVALHLVFQDKAAHDKYQKHPRHLEFIESNKQLWSTVRVFDSYLAISAVERFLQQPVTYAFAQESLEFAIKGLAEEANVGIDGEGIAIRFDQNALQSAGITRNQQIRNFKAADQTVAEILGEIVRQANPIRGAALNSDQQKLVWVIDGNSILITTRAGASKNEMALPSDFGK